MRVLTLDSAAFGRACRELAGLVAASGFEPQLIVGIRRGGEYVACEMRPCFSRAALGFVGLQRPSTSRKRMFGKVLGRLPRPLLDRLRIIEAYVLAGRHRSVSDLPPFQLPSSLTGLGQIRVLLVDDAVDSGTTMLRVAEALRCGNPEIELRTAAITVTTAAPLTRPDYAIYDDRTLIRFPWSMDA